MKFDLERIKEALEKVCQANYPNRGAQPELVLGCFVGRGVDDDSKCVNECLNKQHQIYQNKCSHYLKAFEKKK